MSLIVSYLARNSRVLILLVALLLSLGLLSFLKVPKLEDPHLNNRNGIILTPFPGAQAKRVESLVTEKLERLVSKVEEIKHINSTSRPGISSIQIELKEEVVNTEAIWSKVRDEISNAQGLLPQGAGPISFDDTRGAKAFTYLLSLSLKTELENPYPYLNRLALDLENLWRAIPGTENVQRFGVNPEEVQFDLDPSTLQSFGLSYEDIIYSIAQHNPRVPSGLVNSSKQRLLIELNGAFESLQELLEIPLFKSGSPPSQIAAIRLGDVANIKRTVADPAPRVALVNGEVSVVIGARMHHETQITSWTKKIMEAQQRYLEIHKHSIEATVLFKQLDYTSERFQDLGINLLIAVFNVTLCLFFLMGIHSALVVAFSLPLTICAVLLGFLLTDIALHQISVTGVVLALGLLIDNAIVIADEIRKFHAKGLSALESGIQAVRHLQAPLLGSTMTTVLSFMPIVLMNGNSGEFIGSIGSSVVYSLLASLLLSLTLVAAFQTMSLERFGGKKMSSHWFYTGFQSEFLSYKARRVIRWVVSNPIKAIMIALVPSIAGFLSTPLLKHQFFPPSNRSQFQLEVRLHKNSSLEYTKKTMLAIQEHLLSKYPNLKIHMYMGDSAPSVYYNQLMRVDGDPSYAGAVLELSSLEETSRELPKIQESLNLEFPGTQIIVRRFGQGPPFESPIELRIYGFELDKLVQLGEKFQQRMGSVQDVLSTRVTLSRNQYKYQLTGENEELHRVGYGLREFAQNFQNFSAGKAAGTLMEESEEVSLRVQITKGQRESIDGLLNQRLSRGSSGEWFDPQGITKLDLESDYSSITRRDQMRCLIIYGYGRDGVLASILQNRFQRIIDESPVVLPSGYKIEFGGETEQSKNTIANLLSTVLVLSMAMILVLMLAFKSYRKVFLIACIAFLSVGIGILPIAYSSFPFGFTSVLAIAGLIGLALNDGIVVLHEIDSSNTGREIKGIVDAVLGCMRHVIATSATTVGGFLPLLISGDNFWGPMALIMSVGIFGATLLAIVFVPASYVLLFANRPK